MQWWAKEQLLKREVINSMDKKDSPAEQKETQPNRNQTKQQQINYAEFQFSFLI